MYGNMFLNEFEECRENFRATKNAEQHPIHDVAPDSKPKHSGFCWQFVVILARRNEAGQLGYF